MLAWSPCREVGTTRCASGWFGHFKDRCGIIIARHDGSRDITAYHEPLRCEREPGELHRSGQLLGRAPTGPTIGGGDETDIELTCINSAECIRVVVIGKRKVGRSARSCPIHGQARDEVIDTTPKGVDRDAFD